MYFVLVEYVLNTNISSHLMIANTVINQYQLNINHTLFMLTLQSHKLTFSPLQNYHHYLKTNNSILSQY